MAEAAGIRLPSMALAASTFSARQGHACLASRKLESVRSSQGKSLAAPRQLGWGAKVRGSRTSAQHHAQAGHLKNARAIRN